MYLRQPYGFKCQGTTLRGLISNAYVVTGSSAGLGPLGSFRKVYFG